MPARQTPCNLDLQIFIDVGNIATAQNEEVGVGEAAKILGLFLIIFSFAMLALDVIALLWFVVMWGVAGILIGYALMSNDQKENETSEDL